MEQRPTCIWITLERKEGKMTSKRRRKAFLNDLCAALGISDPTDPRRSDAALVFIAFGEEKCRAWLSQACGDNSVWEQLANIKQARKIARMKPKRSAKETSQSEWKKLRQRLYASQTKPKRIARDTSQSESHELRQRSYASQTKRERAKNMIRDGFRAQTTLQKDENAGPKI